VENLWMTGEYLVEILLPQIFLVRDPARIRRRWPVDGIFAIRFA
jgi:hypothetical protein